MKNQTTIKFIINLSIFLFLSGGCATANSGVGGPAQFSGIQNPSIGTRSTPVSASSAEAPKTLPAEKSNTRKAKFRKTIAVTQFENRTTAAGQINLGQGMADQLVNALVQSDNFVVLERQTLGDVLKEQDFDQSERAASSTVAKSGKVLPAQILIKGTITEFALKESGGGAGISYMGFSLGNEHSVSHVGLILRIIDTTSGQVLDSVRIEGKAAGEGYKMGVAYMGFGFEAEKYQNTALSKSVQMVIDQAVGVIARNLNEIPFRGKIIKAKGDTYYTNIGKRNRVTGGDIFDVYSPGEELYDPDTGEKLGSLKKKIGRVVISMPEDKYSKAFSTQGQSFAEGYFLSESTGPMESNLPSGPSSEESDHNEKPL